MESLSLDIKCVHKGQKKLLEAVKNGDVSISDALKKIKALPFEDVDFAKIDHHRGNLCLGYPEVIYGESKTPEQIAQITQKSFWIRENNILITRANEEGIQLF